MPVSEPTSIFKGALLTVLMRWSDRLIGFVSTLILARLLVPADFGIIAMASLVIGLVDVLLDLGVNVALIQNRHATPEHYNSAWTLRLIQATGAALIVLFIAPFAVDYFHDARVKPVLQVLATGLLLASLENIGVITFQKEMRFGLDFRYTFLKRIVGFLVTITAAWLFRSYWALVIGTLTGRLFGVLLSYQMHAMRPRFSLAKFKEIFSVSQWMLVASIGGYLDNNLHKLIVGGGANSATMGGYTLGDDISAMPGSELLAPLNRVLFPAFVRVKHDLSDLKRLFLLAQGVQTLVVVPASMGLALLAHEAVVVLLGEKWLLAVPFVQVLALANMVRAITTSGIHVMIALGRVWSSAFLSWMQVLLLAAIALIFLQGPDALQVAWIRFLTVLAGLPLAVWLLMHTLRNVGLMDIMRSIVRPLLGTGIMALAITTVGALTQFPPFPALLVKIATGVITYSTAIMFMWRLSGKPFGAESYLLSKVAALRKRDEGRPSPMPLEN